MSQPNLYPTTEELNQLYDHYNKTLTVVSEATENPAFKSLSQEFQNMINQSVHQLYSTCSQIEMALNQQGVVNVTPQDITTVNS